MELFRKQMPTNLLLKRVRTESGGVTWLALLSALVIAFFTFQTLSYGIRIRKQIALQRAADLSALAGATWEARGLNLLAGMNQGIVIFLVTAVTAVLITVVLALCSETGIGAAVCGPLLAILETPLQELFKIAKASAESLSDMQKIVVKVVPPMAIAQAVQVGKANGADLPIPYPYLPDSLGGKHGDANALLLHVEKGYFSQILEKALEELPPALRKFVDNPLTKTVFEKFAGAKKDEETRTEQSEISTGIDDSSAGSATEPSIAEPTAESSSDSETSSNSSKPPFPEPMVLDEDFRPALQFGVIAWRGTPGLQDFQRVRERVATAQATAFLPGVTAGEEDLFSMSWEARLVPVTFADDAASALGKMLVPVRDQ